MKELYLNGDLNQMTIQAKSLRDIGIKIDLGIKAPSEEFFNIKRIIAPEDVIKALKYLMKEEIEGWWNYEELLIEYEICNKEQFDRTFHWYIESRR